MRATPLIFVLCIAGLAGLSRAATPAVSAGIGTAYGLSATGEVYSWGGNFEGQLGIAKQYVTGLPGTIRKLPQLDTASAGQEHTLAIGSDGRVYAWGQNATGALGLGDANNRMLPAPVPGIQNALGVAAGGLHSLMVARDGKVFAWGGNFAGAIGKDPLSVAQVLAPAQIEAAPNAQGVSAGAQHSMALDQTGGVWTWGFNAQGQLGDSSLQSRHTPRAVPGLPTIQKIVAGDYTSFAIDLNNQLWGWGHNAYGQLGVDPALSSAQPAVFINAAFKIPGAPKVQTVAAAHDHVLALALDGVVWTWGTNSRGALGHGMASSSAMPTPTAVAIPAKVVAIAAGYRVSFAVDMDGNVWGWGSAEGALLGVGVTDALVPIKIGQLPRFTKLFAGKHRLLATASDGQGWSWGTYSNGQVGSETLPIENTPTLVPGLSGVDQVAAGGAHTLALNSAGVVYGWGSNRNTNLAVSDIVERSLTPTKISFLPTIGKIAAGAVSSYALDRAGKPYTWGDNSEGQLGLGPFVPSREIPTPIATLSLTDVAGGSRHALGIDQDRSLVVWGGNRYGQLGTDAGVCFGGQSGAVCSASPVKVAGVSNIAKVAAGEYHSLVMLANGSLLSTGSNSHGELGYTTISDTRAFAAVPLAEKLVAIAAGARFSLALDETGSVWSWGANDQGQLGLGLTVDQQAKPTKVAGLPKIKSIAAGWATALATAVDGTIWSWGRNYEGSVGDGTFLQRNAPVLVVNPAANGFIDLEPNVENQIPASAIPPFLVKSIRKGDVDSYSLGIDVRGLWNTPLLAPRATQRYRLYVLALAEQDKRLDWFQLNARANWEMLTWPMSSYLSNLSLETRFDTVLVQVFENIDLSGLEGTRIFLGYGLDSDEMLAASRYREIIKISH